jgi:hypothetical protein
MELGGNVFGESEVEGGGLEGGGFVGGEYSAFDEEFEAGEYGAFDGGFEAGSLAKMERRSGAKHSRYNPCTASFV